MSNDPIYRPHHVFDDQHKSRDYPVVRLEKQTQRFGTQADSLAYSDNFDHLCASLVGDIEREAFTKRLALIGPPRIEVIVRVTAAGVSEKAGLDAAHLERVRLTGARIVRTVSDD